MDLKKFEKSGKSIKVSGHNIVPFLASITEFMESKGLDLNPLPKVIISSSKEYAKDPFGKTAFYNPEDHVVTLFVEGRHIKDILRSFAHEMIHHNQFVTGMFDQNHLGGLDDPQYAQHNKHLMKMEEDAYLRGNMLFRAWEDQIK